VLKITHFDILTLRSSPFASLALGCTTRLLMYTSTILSIAVVVGFSVFSTLSLNRGIIDRGNLAFCQRRKVLMTKPVGNVGVVFTFERNAFAKGNRNPFKQVIICLSKVKE
jgi:hypothetical protein